MSLMPIPFHKLLTLSAPSPTWCWNTEGRLDLVPAGQPAYDHDPVTGAPRGIRIQRNDTNYWENSADPSGMTGSGYFTFEPANSIFNGGPAAQRITNDSPLSSRPLSQLLGAIPDDNEIGTAVTISVIVEQDTAPSASSKIVLGIRNNDPGAWCGAAEYDFDTGEYFARFPSIDGGEPEVVHPPLVVKNAGPNGGKTVLLSITCRPIVGNVSCSAHLYPTGVEPATGQTAILHHVQCELKTAMSSPIVTNGQPLARSLTQLYLPTDSAWYRDTGSIFVEFMANETVPGTRDRMAPAFGIFDLSGVSSANRVHAGARELGGNVLRYYSQSFVNGVGSGGILSDANFAPHQTLIVGKSWDAESVLDFQGADPPDETLININDVERGSIYLGQTWPAAGAYLDGWIKSMVVYDKKYTEVKPL